MLSILLLAKAQRCPISAAISAGRATKTNTKIERSPVSADQLTVVQVALCLWGSTSERAQFWRARRMGMAKAAIARVEAAAHQAKWLPNQPRLSVKTGVPGAAALPHRERFPNRKPDPLAVIPRGSAHCPLQKATKVSGSREPFAIRCPARKSLPESCKRPSQHPMSGLLH